MILYGLGRQVERGASSALTSELENHGLRLPKHG